MPLCSQYLQYEWAKPQTTGSSVKFYQPWILIVYSRIMLGNVRSCIFFFLGFCFIYTTPFCQRNSQNQRTHTTQTIHEMFLFFFVMVIVVSSHVRATESASHLVETVMKYFIHPPPPHPCQPIKMFYRNHDLSEFFCKFDCCILLMQK